jgi:hypothetical protein
MATIVHELSDAPSMIHGMIATPSPHQSSHYQTATRLHDPQRQPSGSASRRYREDATVPRNQKQWDPTTTQIQSSAAASSDASAPRPTRLPSPPSSEGHDTPQTSPPPSSRATIEEGASKTAGAAAPPASHSSQPSDPALPDAPDTPAPRPVPRVVKIRDLAHIQSLAQAECVRFTGTGILDENSSAAVRYEISEMPIPDVIEMVAGLLNKITLANDLTHDAKQRNVAHQQQAMAAPEGGSAGTSVLAFHGKNVPAISIHSYLSRIHKYCPTTYEVFLSLLVYFDRMTHRLNRVAASASDSQASLSATTPDVEMHDASPMPEARQHDDTVTQGCAANPAPPATYFVVDNFNIHRLTIAGITCASKFFSDVFYTNSRYAKVGGLPLLELNHLELQFLVLNEFRLFITVETIEAYATMLVEFYARECVASRNGPAGGEGV